MATVSSKQIICPECGARDSITFEGVVNFPVYVAPADGYHYWDYESCEVVDERGYFCDACDSLPLDPDDFVVEIDNGSS